MKTRKKLKELLAEGTIDLRRFMRAIGALGTKLDRKTRRLISSEAERRRVESEQDGADGVHVH